MENEERITRALLDYADRKGLDINYYTTCAEPGYDDKPVLAANWNPPEMRRIGDFIEKMETVSLEWSDEWTGCSHCGAAVRTSPDCYGWTQHYIVFSDYNELVCLNCAKEFPEDIIEEYKNNARKAIMPDLQEVIEKEGFVCYSPDEYCEQFTTGLHPGQDDNPATIAKDIEKNLPDHDYIFKIDSAGQFALSWSVLVRRKDDEIPSNEKTLFNFNTD